MKLIMCPVCHDVFRLFRENRTCKCGKVSGRYLDESDAEVSKDAISIALGNGSLQSAIYRMRDASKDDPNHDREDFQKLAQIHYAWVRPNSGPGNPHTRVKD